MLPGKTLQKYQENWTWVLMRLSFFFWWIEEQVKKGSMVRTPEESLKTFAKQIASGFSYQIIMLSTALQTHHVIPVLRERKKKKFIAIFGDITPESSKWHAWPVLRTLTAAHIQPYVCFYSFSFFFFFVIKPWFCFILPRPEILFCVQTTSYQLAWADVPET